MSEGLESENPLAADFIGPGALRDVSMQQAELTLVQLIAKAGPDVIEIARDYGVNLVKGFCGVLGVITAFGSEVANEPMWFASESETEMLRLLAMTALACGGQHVLACDVPALGERLRMLIQEYYGRYVDHELRARVLRVRPWPDGSGREVEADRVTLLTIADGTVLVVGARGKPLFNARGLEVGEATGAPEVLPLQAIQMVQWTPGAGIAAIAYTRGDAGRIVCTKLRLDVQGRQIYLWPKGKK